MTTMQIDRVTIRLAAPLRQAAEDHAEKHYGERGRLGAWIRHLVERETGLPHYEHPQGFAAMSDDDRKKARQKALRARRHHR